MSRIWIVPFLFLLVLLSQEEKAYDQLEMNNVSSDAHVAYTAGLAYLKSGKYHEALSVSLNALRADPSNPDLNELAGHACTGLRAFDRAFVSYTRAIDFGSRSFHVYKNRGYLYTLQRDWLNAIEDYKKAIVIDPDRPETYCGRADAYRGLCRYAEALADYEEAYKRGFGNAAVYPLARLLATCPDTKVRDGRKALEYARMICESTNFNEPLSLDVFAMALAELGQWEEAVRRAEQALKLIELRHDSDKEYRAAIRLRLELYQIHEPYRQFPPEHSSNWRPLSAAEALLYGIAKMDIEDYKGASEDLQKAVDLNSRLSSAYYALGCAKNHLGYTDAAIKHFDRCLDLDNRNAEALSHRSIAKSLICEFNDALSDANRALSINEKDLWSRLARAWALGGLGEVDRALKELDQMHIEYPDHDQVHFVRGACYLRCGRFDDAVGELSNAIRINTRAPLAYGERAIALSALGKTNEAERDLEECSRLAPPLRSLIEGRMKAMKEKTSLGRKKGSGLAPKEDR